MTTIGLVPNQFTAYMLVNNVTDLQNISTNLAGTYALGKDINAASVANSTRSAISPASSMVTVVSGRTTPSAT